MEFGSRAYQCLPSILQAQASSALALDPRVTLQVAWIATPFQNLYLYHITNHIVLDQSKVCLSVTPIHTQPIRIPEVTGTSLDQPEPRRLHPQCWANRNPSGYVPSAASARTPQVTCTALGKPGPWRLKMPVSCTENTCSHSRRILFSFSGAWGHLEIRKGDVEAYVENIKSVTSSVRGKSRAR